MQLVDAIVRRCAAPSDERATAAIRAAAAPEAWAAVLPTLHAHRLLPMASFALAGEACVPAAVRGILDDAFRRTALTNTLFLHALGRVLRELAQRGVEPVVWKGAVLADSFYADPGMRWMGDVDLAIEPDEVEATSAAFAAAGFTAPPELATRDAIYFEHPSGAIFDVHHRVRLFDGHPTASITRSIEPRHVPAPALRVLAPDAMIAHLVVHLAGHRGDVGYLLSWILDIARVLETWGEEIDPERAEALMVEPRARRLWHRLLGLAAGELGAAVPAWAGARLDGVPPLGLEEIRRQRRLVAWGLPAPRGWMRLGACRVLGRPLDDRPLPRPADLLLWPLDAWRERPAA